MDLSSSIWCFHPDYRLARVKKSVKEPVDYQGMIKKKEPTNHWRYITASLNSSINTEQIATKIHNDDVTLSF